MPNRSYISWISEFSRLCDENGICFSSYKKSSYSYYESGLSPHQAIEKIKNQIA